MDTIARVAGVAYAYKTFSSAMEALFRWYVPGTTAATAEGEIASTVEEVAVAAGSTWEKLPDRVGRPESAISMPWLWPRWLGKWRVARLWRRLVGEFCWGSVMGGIAGHHWSWRSELR